MIFWFKPTNPFQVYTIIWVYGINHIYWLWFLSNVMNLVQTTLYFVIYFQLFIKLYLQSCHCPQHYEPDAVPHITSDNQILLEIINSSVLNRYFILFHKQFRKIIVGFPPLVRLLKNSSSLSSVLWWKLNTLAFKINSFSIPKINKNVFKMDPYNI